MATATEEHKIMDKNDVHMANLHKVLQNCISRVGKDDLALHLKNLFGFLVLHYPGQALEKFEEASYLIRNKLDVQKFLKTNDLRDYTHVAANQSNYIKEMQKRFAGPQPEEEGGEVPEAAPVGFVQDLRSDSKIFQWAGVGFGEQETYRLQKSLKKLAADTQASQIRFFGKIHGTESDYYICETVVEGGEEEGGDEGEKDADFEAKGTGVNKYTYFVAPDSMSVWTRLPDISPKDIAASRRIKVLFTGNLNRPIFTNPFFAGCEKHYLRAQIARINHSTALLPKGVMRLVEDSPREIEENTPEEGELVMPTTEQMGKTESWVHANLNILKNCRTAHLDPTEPEGAEDWDEEKAKAAIESQDPYAPRLKPINLDDKVCGQNPWVVRLMGDTMEYGNPKGAFPTISSGVVVVRSLQWPGAFSFYSNGQVQSVYVGSGHKYEQKVSYFPVEPPLVIEDPEEFEIKYPPAPKTEVVAEEVAQEGEAAAEEEGGDE